MPYGTVNADLMATSSGQSLGAGNATGFKNRIINGAMVIDQRYAGASVTPTSNFTYTLDRWVAGLIQSSKFSVQQSSVAPAGFSNSILITSLSAYSVTSSDYFNINQFIEGFNWADLGFGTSDAKTVTLSFWVRSSLTGTFGGALGNSAGSRAYPFTYTISAANTWEYKTITIAGDTTGTWVGATNGIGARLWINLGAGSTFSGTAGSWQAANLISATGATSVVGTNGATFYITGVQLEVGSSASSFEVRDYGRELILCQRYYEVQTANQYQVIASYNTGSTNFYTSGGTFAVVKRTAPTFVGAGSGAWAITGVNLYSASGVTTFGAANITTSTYALLQTRVAGGASPSGGQIFQFEGSTTFTFSAEL